MAAKIKIWMMALHSLVVNTHVLEERTAFTFTEDKAYVCPKYWYPPTRLQGDITQTTVLNCSE